MAFFSCSSPSEPASQRTTILSISEDTLFTGDHFTVVTDRDISRDSIQLFIGTSPCSIDSVIGEKIYARSSGGEGAYRLRLYSNSQEAAGDFIVYLVSRSIDNWAKKYVGYYPREGEIGDTIQFWVDSAAIDPATLRPALQGILLDFLSVKGKYAYYVVPPSAQDVPMQVRVFDRHAELERFDVIRPATDLPFEEGTLQAFEIAVGVNAHVVRVARDGTTDQFDLSPVQGNFSFSPNGSAKLTITDSIRLDHAIEGLNYSRYCSIRAHYDPLSRLISGHISYYRSEPEREGVRPYQSMEIEFKDLAWNKKGGAYHLFLDSGAMSHVSILKMKHGDIGDGYWVTGTYEAPLHDPDFISIGLAP